VMLILTADTADTLLATIRSRCQPVHLRTLPATTVRQALEQQHKVEPDRAALLSQLSGGRVGWAIRAADDESLLSQRTQLLEMLDEEIGQSRVGRFALAEGLSKDKPVLLNALELWQSYWRDVMLMSHGANTPITNRDRRHAIQQLAVGVSVDDVQRAITATQR